MRQVCATHDCVLQPDIHRPESIKRTMFLAHDFATLSPPTIRNLAICQSSGNASQTALNVAPTISLISLNSDVAPGPQPARLVFHSRMPSALGQSLAPQP